MSIAPLGAGDLIDRAVRLYRKDFWTFVLIAAPPVIVGTLFSIGWMLLARQFFFVGATYRPEEMWSYVIFMWLGGIVIWLTETVAVLTIMGGASRNFVRHLLFNEPITFRKTYKNTFGRLFGLILASGIIAVLLGIVGITIFYFGLFVTILIAALVFIVFSFSQVLATIVSFIFGFGVAVFMGWLFFLIAARFAYVPQVMLVEGQGVVAAIGRSMTLASGNVKRFAALFIFTTVVTYSALAILFIPLKIYAWYSGIELFFSNDVIPAWYEIANQMVGQISFILLMPVWMIGLCLLYVDERVRHEGYDIELMAARQLGEIPAVPSEFVNPLQPALSKNVAEASVRPRTSPPSSSSGSGITTLGLD